MPAAGITCSAFTWRILVTSLLALVLPLPALAAQQITFVSRLNDQDFVLAYGTCVSRLPLAQSSRAWRGNIRTLIAIEDEKLAKQLNSELAAKYSEHYVYWPNRPGVKHLSGDHRVALAPWLAHELWRGTYKWLLYGDDDTIFFPAGIKEELSDYNYRLPYVITDSWYHGSKGRLFDAPRCLPCHKTPQSIVESMPKLDSFMYPDFVPPVGCPCTPELACEFTKKHKPEQFSNRTDPLLLGGDYMKYGGVPFRSRYPTLCEHSSTWGGAGSVISVAALEKVGIHQAIKCLYDHPENLTFEGNSVLKEMYCDKLFSLCMWLNGVAITEPGYTVYNGEAAKLTDNLISKSIHHFEEVLAGGHDSEHWLLKRVISVHFHARQKFRQFEKGHANGIEGAAEYMGNLGALHHQVYNFIMKQQ